MRACFRGLSQPAFLLDRRGRVLHAHIASLSSWLRRNPNCEHDDDTLARKLVNKPFVQALQFLGVQEIDDVRHEFNQFWLGWSRPVSRKILCTLPHARFYFTCILTPPWSLFSKIRAVVLFGDEAPSEESVMGRFSLFLNNAGHELRTPLNAVLGFAELLQRELDNSTGVDLKKSRMYAGCIASGSRSLSRVFSQLVDLVRLSIRAMPLCEEVVDARLILEEVLRKVQCAWQDDPECDQGYGPQRGVYEGQVELTATHGEGGYRVSICSGAPNVRVCVDVEKLVRALSYLVIETTRIMRPSEPAEIGLKRVESGSLSFYISCRGPGGFSDDFLDAVQKPLLLHQGGVGARGSGQMRQTVDFVLACALADLHGGFVELNSQKDKSRRDGGAGGGRKEVFGERTVRVSLVLPEGRVVQ